LDEVKAVDLGCSIEFVRSTISAVPADTLVITDNLDRAVRATVEGLREENDPGYRSYA
jgi:hypothetical protein